MCFISVPYFPFSTTIQKGTSPTEGVLKKCIRTSLGKTIRNALQTGGGCTRPLKTWSISRWSRHVSNISSTSGHSRSTDTLGCQLKSAANHGSKHKRENTKRSIE